MLYIDEEVSRVRDALLPGFRSEAYLILDSKMDKKEADDLLSGKYDREAGKDCEEEIQKLKAMLKKLQSLLVISLKYHCSIIERSL